MGMSSFDEKYIAGELKKRFPEMESYDDDYYGKVQSVYNVLDDVVQWKLEEIVDADTFEKRWYWVRKS